MKNYNYEKMAQEGYECECEAKGFCPLLQKTMTGHLHHLCKTDERYRKRFLQNAMKRGVHNSQVKREQIDLIVRKNELHKAADAAIDEMKENGIDLDKNEPSKGLGDTIEKVLAKFGITQDKVEKIAGSEGCGCGGRKKWFNKIFNYNKEKEDE